MADPIQRIQLEDSRYSVGNIIGYDPSKDRPPPLEFQPLPPLSWIRHPRTAAVVAPPYRERHWLLVNQPDYTWFLRDKGVLSGSGPKETVKVDQNATPALPTTRATHSRYEALLTSNASAGSWGSYLMAFTRAGNWMIAIPAMWCAALIYFQSRRGTGFQTRLNPAKLSHRIFVWAFQFDLPFLARASNRGTLTMLTMARFRSAMVVVKRFFFFYAIAFACREFWNGHAQTVVFPFITALIGLPATPLEARWMNVLAR